MVRFPLLESLLERKRFDFLCPTSSVGEGGGGGGRG